MAGIPSSAACSAARATPSLHARHARHRHGRLALVHKERPDEISRREHRLGDSPTQPGMLPRAAEAGRGKSAVVLHG
jgi:hypothetical protein